MKSRIELYTEWMENLAIDDSHGYAWGGWGPQDYDCSHAVITALQTSGIPVKDYGATYTGNMKDAILACGGKDVTASVNLGSGNGLKRGDILLNIANHVAVYIGGGRLVHARSSEGNNIPGDQNGQEIRIQQYFNYPWDCVLRFTEAYDYDDDDDTEYEPEPVTPEEPKTSLVVDGECGPETWKALADGLPLLQQGSFSTMVMALQHILNYHGARLKVDSDYGPLTAEAVRKCQMRYKP